MGAFFALKHYQKCAKMNSKKVATSYNKAVATFFSGADGRIRTDTPLGT